MSIKRSIPRAALVLAAATLALSGCGASGDGDVDGSAAGSSDQSSETGEPAALTIGAGVEPESFDPAQSREAQFVQYFQPAFDTLIRRMPDGTPGEMLATGWEYDETNTVLTLTLRDDVTFIDGETFDAESAKANIDRFQTAGGPLAGNLASIESTEAPDATTLVLNLSTPDPALIFALGGPGGYMQSPAQFDSESIDTQPVGSGPYVLDRDASTPGSEYLYTANEDYWNPDLQEFDSITLLVLQDENARLNALSSGQIDAMLGTPKTIAQAESSGLNVDTIPADWEGLSLFDRDGELTPELADVRVRQAINHALDKEALLENISLGHGEVTSQIFSPASEAFDPELDSYYAYDVEQARSLMDEAGLDDGFTLQMPSSSDMDPAVAPAVRDQLAEIGITVEWEDFPTAEYQAEQQSGNFSAAFTAFGQTVRAWGNISQMVGPAGAWNVFGSESDEAEDLMDQILTLPADEADPTYRELNALVVEEAWFSPWYRIDLPYYTNDDIVVEMQNGQPVPSIYNFAPAN